MSTFLLLTAWAALMAIAFVALKLRSGGGAAGLAAAWTGRPHCPSCRIGMNRLSSRTFPPRTYWVWACPRCTNVLTTSADGQGDVPGCPACHQHALLTPAWRLPSANEGEPQVQVHEACPVCGHHAVEEFPELDADPRQGQVIQFPGRHHQAE